MTALGEHKAQMQIAGLQHALRLISVFTLLQEGALRGRRMQMRRRGKRSWSALVRSPSDWLPISLLHMHTAGTTSC